jgi:hypothetical protein
MTQVAMIRAWVVSRIRETREDDERGELLTWVIMTALLAAAAIAVVAVIVTKATDTANNTKTQ